MSLFRKRPVEVEAFCLFVDPMPDWFMDRVSANDVMLGYNRTHPHESGAIIATLEGKMSAAYGDWIIRGVKGEIYPCKPDIFVATYEPVDPTAVMTNTPAQCRVCGLTIDAPTKSLVPGECPTCSGPMAERES